MKNMMKEYLKDKYSDNHLRNFCLYWIKASQCKAAYRSGDEWRMENDLDCQYFDGDLKADTLMSAWTPIKWVANCLNRAIGISFSKTSKEEADPYHDLKLLAEYGDLYLPPEHALVKLLNRFLELAELRCNFILLPARGMNSQRYKIEIGNSVMWLCDEVPATLAHLFDRESLGKFFTDDSEVIKWIKREHLEMGFEDGKFDLYHVKPLVDGLDPYVPLWPESETDIASALKYMIDFLETRMKVLTDIENNPEIEESLAGENRCMVDVSEEVGDICFSHSARGQNNVAWLIGKVFGKAIEAEGIKNISRMDFFIKGDFSDEESGQVENLLGRLYNWHDREGGIEYSWKCQKDENMKNECEVSAVLHLKEQNRISVPLKADLLKDEDLVRPEGITDNALWELYKLFRNMRRPYIWVDTSPRGEGKYRLYLIEEAKLGYRDTYYAVENMGIELPWSRDEWMTLRVKPLFEKNWESPITIHTDAIMYCDSTVEEILKRNHVKLPEGVR